ncbi:MAG: hypothetical protein ACK5KO_00595 [Arachnia sp.]
MTEVIDGFALQFLAYVLYLALTLSTLLSSQVSGASRGLWLNTSALGATWSTLPGILWAVNSGLKLEETRFSYVCPLGRFSILPAILTFVNLTGPCWCASRLEALDLLYRGL